MTENEARSKIKYRIEVAREIAGNGVDGKAFEDLEIALQVMKEIREYRELGSVEEFKAYKLGDCMNDCEHYDNCSNYIYSKGYNEAIDKFAEEIAFGIYESVIWDMLATMSKNGSLSDTSDKIVDYVIETSKKIANQMKGGAE